MSTSNRTFPDQDQHESALEPSEGEGNVGTIRIDDGERSPVRVRPGLLVATACGAILLGYAGAIGFLAIRETSLVFASAGQSPVRVVPPSDAAFTWDTLRVRDGTGASVFLMESRLDDWSSRPWVIYFHGNSGSIGSRGNVRRYALLRDAGFN